MNKHIAIDFDGVIAEYEGWKGIGVFGKPIAGVKKALEKFKAAGNIIIIHTTRGEVEAIKKYMALWEIPYDYINFNPNQAPHMNQGKPIADVYIDDRAVTFNGSWNNTFLEQVLNFKSWYKKEKK